MRWVWAFTALLLSGCQFEREAPHAAQVIKEDEAAHPSITRAKKSSSNTKKGSSTARRAPSAGKQIRKIIEPTPTPKAILGSQPQPLRAPDFPREEDGSSDQARSREELLDELLGE